MGFDDGVANTLSPAVARRDENRTRGREPRDREAVALVFRESEPTQ